MRFTLEIECDNAAFEDDLTGELTRILADVAERIPTRSGFGDCAIHDLNGNWVGRFRLDGEG